MNFAKESKRFYIQELKGQITNNFSFNIKSLHRVSHAIEQSPPICKICQMPLGMLNCLVCGAKSSLPEQTNFPHNFIFKQQCDGKEEISQSMILCIDLSGSMCVTYESKYQKINQEFVKRVLGQKNFQYLKKKIGLEKVVKNYSMYQMLISSGESVRSIAEMVKMQQSQKSISSVNKSSSEGQKGKKQKKQFISRKQIIEIGVQKCIQIMKSRKPNTQITVVYFNQTIEIPIDQFKDKHVIDDIKNKTVEQMISLGEQYSNFISRFKAGAVNESLLMNLTKASENGQTALGPSLAFCFGLAKAFKNSLTQIVIITDGMSNIGFGQTQNQQQLEITKQFYQKLALIYAKPLNCVTNFITFQDCCIGYEQLDKLVEVTGGIPCQIQFTQEGGEKIVTQETFSNLSFKMITAFCEYANRLCFDTQIIVCCPNQKVKLTVPKELQSFVQENKGNIIILKTGILSSTLNIEINFSLPEELEEFEGVLKFYVISQFKKGNNKYKTLTVEKIKIVKGTKDQAQKEEVISLQKQLKKQLKPREIFEEDIKQYGNISIKLQQNQNLMKHLDQQLLEKFKAKKQKLETVYKNIDRLSREKISMRSRAQKTYSKQEDDFDDGFK